MTRLSSFLLQIGQTYDLTVSQLTKSLEKWALRGSFFNINNERERTVKIFRILHFKNVRIILQIAYKFLMHLLIAVKLISRTL